MKLELDELKKLLELTDRATNMPVIAMSVEDGIKGMDWATLAWNNVRDYWQELGKKYNFNPEHVRGIDRKTGEVMVNK